MTDKLANTSYRKKDGRPSSAEQVAISNLLKPYFEMGVSAEFVSNLPGMPNVNTIKAYFREWKKKYLEDESPNITERQMQVKGQFLAVFDKMIFNLSAQLNQFVGLRQNHLQHWKNEVERAKKESKPEPIYKADPFYEKMFKDLCKLICEMESAKAAVVSAPYANETTYNAVLVRLREKRETEKRR